MNLIIYLLGSNHGECMEIPAGVHNYSFSCQLPNNIPFSIEGKYGYVRFKIDANLDIAWGFDYKATKDIHVARYEDLNYFPELRASTKIQTLKSFWSWTGKSNKVFLNVCLPKTGFALGEIIPVNVEIKNESSVDIEHTTIALNQVGRYNSTCPHVKTEELKAVIVKERGRGVKSCQTTQFQVLLEIPQVLVISNNRYCKVFQISYEVELVGITTGLHQSPKVFTKITVGSVRLTSNDELIGLNATAPIDSNEDTASLYDHRKTNFSSVIFLLKIFFFLQLHHMRKLSGIFEDSSL